jgi:hypothetical protein
MNTSAAIPETDTQRASETDAALVAVDLLGLANMGRIDRAAKRFGWFAGRTRFLASLGRIAEQQGNDAALSIARKVLEGVYDGAIKSTRQANQLAEKLVQEHP